MDRSYIEANNIVARYLAGDLTVREAREFERFCAEHPAVLDSLPIPVRVKAKMQLKAAEAAKSAEFDPTVQTGAFLRPTFDKAPAEDFTGHVTDDADDEFDADTTPDVRERQSLVQRIKSASLVTLALTLALVLVSVMATVFWSRSNALQNELSALQRSVKAIQMRPPNSVREHRATPVAAQPTAPTLTLGYPDPPQLIELRVDMSKGRFNTFLVTVDSVNSGRIAQIRRVARDSNGELRLSLNTSAFGKGDIDLQFAGYTWRGETVPVGWIRLGMQ